MTTSEFARIKARSNHKEIWNNPNSRRRPLISQDMAPSEIKKDVGLGLDVMQITIQRTPPSFARKNKTENDSSDIDCARIA